MFIKTHCRYWQRGYCFRVDLCEFTHKDTEKYGDGKMEVEEKICVNCKGVAHFPFFCEFCGENFCAKCTVKEAHDENYITTTDVLGCKRDSSIQQCKEGNKQ